VGVYTASNKALCGRVWLREAKTNFLKVTLEKTLAI